MNQKERNITSLVVSRMMGTAPGMTKEEAARKLNISLRSIDGRVLRYVVDILKEKNISL